MFLLLAATLFSVAQSSDGFDSRKAELRQDLLLKNGGSQKTEVAVEKALAWLAKNQRADGTWSSAEGDNVLGVTALSLLAFLGAGHTPKAGTPAEQLRLGGQWLLRQQADDGLLGPGKELKNIYGHLLGAAALAELAGMTGEEIYRIPAQRAIDRLLSLQSPGGGWRYDPAKGDSDSSVTGWALQALESAEAARLNVPPSAVEGALRWFNSVTDETGRTGYRRRGDNIFVRPGLGDPPDNPLSRTAFAVLAGWRHSGKRSEGFALLTQNPPNWSYYRIDFCYFYAASRALLAMDGPGGSDWKAWNQALAPLLLQHQIQDGADAGSWKGEDSWSDQGGRVYATAINALTLEVYYRAFPRRSRRSP